MPRSPRPRLSRSVAPLLLLPLLLLSWSAAALEQAGLEQYKPYRPETIETVSAPLLVVVAYSAIFVVLLAYVALLFSRQRHLERELEELERKLKRTE